MPLQVSGTITFSDLDTEIGTPGATLSMCGYSGRSLSGIASGAVKMSNFYGKTQPPVIYGALYTAGQNDYGQLGDSTVANKSSPIQTTSGGADWKQISCGYRTTAAIKTDGTLWTWGAGALGQLGNNSAPLNRTSPGPTISGGTTWKQVSVGNTHVAAIKTDGTLWNWGSGIYGQLGVGTTGATILRSSPVQTISGGTTWKQVSAGLYQTLAIKTDNVLWAWGINYFDWGTFNNGGTGPSTLSNPAQVSYGQWKQVDCSATYGAIHVAAINTSGQLFMCGTNLKGQLGDNTAVSKSVPVQTVAGGTNWSQVSCGISITAAVKTDGTLWTWGYNLYGQLGINTIADKSSPVQTIAGGNTWKQVACGHQTMVALKTDGTLWGWGTNTGGQFGDGTVTQRNSPVQLFSGGNTWKQVDEGTNYTAAVK